MQLGKFSKFTQKKSKLSVWLKIGRYGILVVLIPNLDLKFWNSDAKTNIWANFDRTSKKCPFCLNIGPRGISRMLIFIPTLVFWISNPKFIFWENSSWKSRKVCFARKLTHRVSRGCDWKDIPGKVRKQRQKWIIVLSACCSYIFIVAKVKNWSNKQNENCI